MDNKESIKEKLIKNKKIVIPVFIAIVVIIAIIVIVLINNSSSDIKAPTKTYAQFVLDMCLTDYKYRLKDPDSMRVYGSNAYYKNDTLQYILIDVGAKNGFGGMTRDYILYNSLGSYMGSISDDKTKSLIDNKGYTVLDTSTNYDNWKRNRTK